MITLKCIACQKNFEAKRKDTKYCSICKKKRRSLQTMLSRKKKYPNIEIGVGSGNAKSNEKGMNNHNTTTGIMIYRDLIERDKCSICNSTEHLCVHHIDHNRYNNDITNLVCICKKCHQLHHVKRDNKGRFQTNTEVND